MNDLGENPLRPSLFLRVYSAVIIVLVVASATQADPAPALHGDGLLVLAALVAFLGAVVLSMLRGRPGDRRLLGLVALTALALTLLQPDGAGFLALYMTLGIFCVQLPMRQAILGFLAGVALITLAGVVVQGTDSLSDTLVGDAIGTLFFLMAYAARSSRVGLVEARGQVAELEASREAHAVAVQLRERARLAREMHDVLAHSLSALAVQLEGARLLASARGADPELTATLERSHGLARAGLEEARRAIEALRGGSMPGPDSLPDLCKQFLEGTDVDCSLQLDGEPRELSSEARLAVYRTAQEALTNVRRHARPDHVDVRLRYAQEGTWLVVEDVRADGDAGPAAGEREEGLGYGLTGMRERAELLGGRLAAAPTDHGFRVELFLPEPEPEVAMADGR
jgi:signal transduction histidine kinase